MSENDNTITVHIIMQYWMSLYCLPVSWNLKHNWGIDFVQPPTVNVHVTSSMWCWYWQDGLPKIKNYYYHTHTHTQSTAIIENNTRNLMFKNYIFLQSWSFWKVPWQVIIHSHACVKVRFVWTQLKWQATSYVILYHS